MLDDDLFFYFLWSFLLECLDLQMYKKLQLQLFLHSFAKVDDYLLLKGFLHKLMLESLISVKENCAALPNCGLGDL